MLTLKAIGILEIVRSEGSLKYLASQSPHGVVGCRVDLTSLDTVVDVFDIRKDGPRELYDFLHGYHIAKETICMKVHSVSFSRRGTVWDEYFVLKSPIGPEKAGKNGRVDMLRVLCDLFCPFSTVISDAHRRGNMLPREKTQLLMDGIDKLVINMTKEEFRCARHHLYLSIEIEDAGNRTRRLPDNVLD